MVMIDFEYNGELLSEHGCIVGSVISSTEDSQPEIGSLTLNTVQIRNKNRITSTKYDEPLTKTFDIIKNPCDNNKMTFTEPEIASLMVWLNRKEFYKFQPVYDDQMNANICFFGTFTEINAIYIGGNIVGFTLTLTTDSPYGYVDYDVETFNISSSNPTFSIYNNSQELGYLYPEYVQIKCTGDGDVYLWNNQDEQARYTIIKNCVDGEIITIDCEHEIITTSNASHPTLMNDFNYNFPRLVRNYQETYNTFRYDTSKINGLRVSFKYKTVRKVGVIE